MFKKMKDLEGTKGVVTGASRGLGLAIAKSLLAAGATLKLTARRSPEFDRKIAYLEGQFQNRVEGVAVDFSDLNEVAKVAPALTDDIDFLVSNAGVLGPLGLAEEQNIVDVKDAQTINMLAPVLICQHAIRAMKRKKRGRILFISGGGCGKADPMFTSYSLSKTGILGYASSLAAELVDHDILVNSILPGPMDTSMNDAKIEAGECVVGHAYNSALERVGNFESQVKKPVDLIKALLVCDDKRITGRIFSAQWDDWGDLLRSPEQFQLSENDFRLERYARNVNVLKRKK